jgi:hypothetical protein
VSQLDGYPGACPVYSIDDRSQRIPLLVVPEAEVGGAYPALRTDRRRLDYDQRHASGRAFGVVPPVPVTGQSVDRRILTHRRHEQTVGQFKPAKF